MKQYLNRQHAGQLLARELQHYRDRQEVVVLGLPRGGIPVAAEVARGLHARLDVVVVRKIGVPSQREVAMGALAVVSGHLEMVSNKKVLDRLGSRRQAEAMFVRAANEELAELHRREQIYRATRPAVPIAGSMVILVDDGLATGATMRAAVAAVRSQIPARIDVAVPVGGRDTCREIEALVDELVCLRRPDPFRSVGQAYRDFEQTTDEDVRIILASGPDNSGGQDPG